MKKPLILLSVAFAVFFSLLAHAQNYPAKPIRFVLSYPPGGATDTLGRIVAKTLSDAWGVNVIADNRPGASGNIGTALCAKAPPDGYTMCMVAPAQAIAFEAVAEHGLRFAQGFLARNAGGDRADAAAGASRAAGKESRGTDRARQTQARRAQHASSGGGASPHLAMELLKQQAGVDITLITYKGAGAQMVDHLAGRVEVAFAPAVGVMPFVKEGRLRAIAVSTKDRFPVLPNVPTASESGLKGYNASSWQGISMPAGVPLELRRHVSDELAKALKTPALRERVLELGGVAVGNTPEQFAAYYAAESEKWFKVARTAHVTMD